MFLTSPKDLKNTLSPYSGLWFSSLCASRDKKNFFSSSISYELAFIGLTFISLIENAIRFPFSLLGMIFSENAAKWRLGMNISILTSIFSVYACFCHFFVKNISTHLIYLDCYFRFYLANQFLLQACIMKQKDLARTLVKNLGADPHHVFHKIEITPALVAHFVGMGELFPLNSYEKTYLELKHLSHWLSLHGNLQIQGRTISLEGAPSFLFFQSLAASFKRFYASSVFKLSGLTKDQIDLLQEALLIAHANYSSTDTADRIRKGLLSFLNGGWSKHGICLSFYDEYMAIGNPGERNASRSTLEVYKINPKKITPEIIEEIYKYSFLNREEGETYVYEVLPSKLSETGKAEQDAFCTNFHKIAPKSQKDWLGTCSLTSKKTVLRFVLAMLLNNNLERAKLESKLFTNWTAIQYFKKANIPIQYAAFPSFIEKATESYKKKLERYKKIRWEIIVGTYPNKIFRRVFGLFEKRCV